MITTAPDLELWADNLFDEYPVGHCICLQGEIGDKADADLKGGRQLVVLGMSSPHV